MIHRADPLGEFLARPKAHPIRELLLVNKTFLRIYAPLAYRTITFTSAHNHLIQVLRQNTRIPVLVKTLVLSGGPFGSLSELAAICQHIEELDLTLDNTHWEQGERGLAVAFLKKLQTLKFLVIRKKANLIADTPRLLMNSLAEAIPCWTPLVSGPADRNRPAESLIIPEGMRKHRIRDVAGGRSNQPRHRSFHCP